MNIKIIDKRTDKPSEGFNLKDGDVYRLKSNYGNKDEFIGIVLENNSKLLLFNSKETFLIDNDDLHEEFSLIENITNKSELIIRIE